MTMTLVATSVVGSGGAASIEFTGIPQDADDLLLVFSLRSAGNDWNTWPVFNSDTGSNYSWRNLRGSGSAAASLSGSSGSQAITQSVASSAYTSNTFSNGSLYIPNYTSSVAKSWSLDSVTENNATDSYQTIQAGVWSGTAAITSVKMPNNSNFVQFSTISLYKITKA